MKIAIATFYNTINYGGALQAYALQRKLQQMGHTPFFVKYETARKVTNLRSWLGKTPQQTLEKWTFMKRFIQFSKFQNKFLIVDETNHGNNFNVDKHPPKADVYLCGSDQIWNYNYVSLEKERLFWLDFGSDSVKRIAYASSFGVLDLPSDVHQRFSNYIKRFSAIAVRESSAIELVSSLGFDRATWVIDPTLLLDTSDYLTVENVPKRQNPRQYYFCYHVGKDDETNVILRQIRDYLTAKTGLHFHYNAIGVKTPKNHTYGPGEWLSKIKNCAFVVADSFHAIMFSLVYKKDFIVTTCGKTKSRLTSILQELDLEERAVESFESDKIRYLHEKKIDWPAVQERINALRKYADEYLQSNLLDI